MADSPELMGTVLGGVRPRPYPGLAPLSHKLSDLQKEVSDLEAQTYELKQIRATLLLNFGAGSPHNHYGFSVTDNGSTLDLLLTVLQNATRVNSPYVGAPPVGASKPEEK